MKRHMNFALGLGAVALGIAGAFLPVMPSTIFFIFAAYFFSKSSERMENWVLGHPRFGPPVRQWQATRSISRPAKIAALIGMSVSLVIMLVTGTPPIGLMFAIPTLALSALYVWTRPEIPVSPIKKAPAVDGKDDLRQDPVKITK